MNLLTVDGYKSIFRSVVDRYKAQFGQRFTYEKLANACGLQKTYLSRVLNGHLHLNADQCYLGCEFLQLNSVEKRYTCLQHALETSAVPARKKELEREIQKLRKEHLRTDRVLAEKTDFSDALGWTYFSNANLQLVYLFLTVEAFAVRPVDIAERIGISEFELQQLLLKLQSMGLVKSQNGQFLVQPFLRHLGDDSPFINSFRQAHRIKTLGRLQSPPRDDDYFFSAIFSADESAARTVKKALLEAVAQTQKAVAKAGETDIYQINLDFVNWT